MGKGGKRICRGCDVGHGEHYSAYDLAWNAVRAPIEHEIVIDQRKTLTIHSGPAKATK